MLLKLFINVLSEIISLAYMYTKFQKHRDAGTSMSIIFNASSQWSRTLALCGPIC